MSLNNDKELLVNFNVLLNRYFGTFIQIYIKENSSDFVNGKLVLEAKIVSANGKPIIPNKVYLYNFMDSSVINKNLVLYGKSLSMKLK